jgi:hypothetical protein
MNGIERGGTKRLGQAERPKQSAADVPVIGNSASSAPVFAAAKNSRPVVQSLVRPCSTFGLAPARPQDLQPACAGGRMHRQGQRPCSVRFGVKVSLANALPGNPYDGHTLQTVIPDMEKDHRQRNQPHPRRRRLAATTAPKATSSGSSLPARSAA